MIEGAHEPPVLVINSIAIPEREVGLEEFRLVTLAKFPQAQAGELAGGAGAITREMTLPPFVLTFQPRAPLHLPLPKP
jgi:hypothetical protein